MKSFPSGGLIAAVSLCCVCLLCSLGVAADPPVLNYPNTGQPSVVPVGTVAPSTLSDLPLHVPRVGFQTGELGEPPRNVTRFDEPVPRRVPVESPSEAPPREHNGVAGQMQHDGQGYTIQNDGKSQPVHHYPSVLKGAQGSDIQHDGYQKDAPQNYWKSVSTETVMPVPAQGGKAYEHVEWVGKSDGWASSCGACGKHSCCGCWFGSVGAVFMTRDQENPVWFSFDTANIGAGLLSSRDAQMGWGGGTEVRIGRLICDGAFAWEAVYWGVYPGVREANAYDPDGVTPSASDLNTTLAFQALDYLGLGNPIVGWFDSAVRHRLQRSYQIHNVEWNLINFTGCEGYGLRGCRPWQSRWYAGLRYFRFDEGFDFASDDTDAVFSGSADEVHYIVDVENHLIGFQLGNRLDYRVGNRLSLYSKANIGLYGNHIRNYSFVGGSGGAAVVNDPASPNNGRLFDITSSKDDVAMLGELEAGLRYQLTCRWSIYGGYRAVGVTGVALSTSQIPQNFGDLDGVANVDSNCSLILHGGFAGLEFNY